MSQKNKEIAFIVDQFYEVAINDIFIGHHFRKIEEIKSTDPTALTLKAFQSHIPRINSFWQMQLLTSPEESKKITESLKKPFDLINLHKALNIKKGELGRWLLLFKETLNNNNNKISNELYEQWLLKLAFFENTFNNKLF